MARLSFDLFDDTHFLINNAQKGLKVNQISVVLFIAQLAARIPSKRFHFPLELFKSYITASTTEVIQFAI